jgi:hypothetical protein
MAYQVRTFSDQPPDFRRLFIAKQIKVGGTSVGRFYTHKTGFVRQFFADEGGIRPLVKTNTLIGGGPLQAFAISTAPANVVLSAVHICSHAT